jgi:hypothetical protein
MRGWGGGRGIRGWEGGWVGGWGGYEGYYDQYNP